MKLSAVIGSGWGDEGKGLVTDWLSGSDTMVVRFNGGAQAGHTVETGDRRHVFSHFGSGTFAGGSTFLSCFFVTHPMLFVKERRELFEKARLSPVLVDPRALVTTPFDVILNQAAEKARQDRKSFVRGSEVGHHGSCGVGFGETIERSQHPRYTLTFRDIWDRRWFSTFHVEAILRDIRSCWVPERAEQLGISREYLDVAIGDGVMANYLRDLDDLARATVCHPWEEAINMRSSIVFEGAQGLQLDQDNKGYFPHVTRSKTGMHNVVKLLQQADVRDPEIDVWYVTRSFATRHGAGPFPHEDSPRVPFGLCDKTNVMNKYQGHLRTAQIDFMMLVEAILADIKAASAAGVRVNPKAFVTWGDTPWGDSKVHFKMGSHDQESTVGDFAEMLASHIGADEYGISTGPMRRDIIRRRTRP